MTIVQDELPFEDGGYTQPRDFLLSLFIQAKQSRQARRNKPDTSGINLSQPLLQGVIFDAAWELPVVSDPQGESTSEQAKSAARESWDQMPVTGRNSEFSVPTIEDICKIAANLLHTQLEILMYSYGNAAVKQEIIDWIFADSYVLADGHVAKKPLHKIPFTAQFCCQVEEIDYEAMCEAIHIRLDQIREAQEARSNTAQYQRTGIKNEKDHQRAVRS
jgi:hypothetical protein